MREKDTLLRELRHRVKNNLQMMTALIRLERAVSWRSRKRCDVSLPHAEGTRRRTTAG
ncbi:histidine kinase dimerization/phosphoacceptor domain -containing protein [Mesorhizobium sp. 113-3-3]|uniref:histidine kinase dimerization/phosphoacceptor domain -containing protein n=1 Tax=Mesorhizobium sp. 113-3-3 TaxID=2744516 RepID=UPI001FD1AA8E|nr:histidine kinase dimerization/phosphoacceptor domain -containing protein [Mesorhizobium sp. 113-3-3]